MEPGERALRRRRHETYIAAQEIHGGSDTNTAPGEIGLLDTVVHKISDESRFIEAFEKSKKINKKVIPKMYKKKAQEFEDSTDNMTRSVAVYYNGGVMGKKKYRAIYKDLNYKHSSSSSNSSSSTLGRNKALRITVNDCPLPRLVPYNKLMPFITGIDVGNLYDVRETLCVDLPEEKKVDGVYRDLKELILKLAEFYLTNQDYYELKWFEGNINTFYVSLGGDGAPFGKDDTAVAWLVSILNIGRGILSSNENYLLFGANCQESCEIVSKFVKNLARDINAIENSTFSVICNGTQVEVKFCFSEYPNDMKMLSYLAGELTNGAKYFSTFADASTDDYNSLSGTFGEDDVDKWKPWRYNERLQVVKEVEKLKKSQEKSRLAASTKRNRVTKLISSLKSRQEFVPLLGELIDRAHVDPLHLKNNACAQAHRLLLNNVIQISYLSGSVTSFSQVPTTSPFFKFVSVMKTCHMSRLAKRIIKWFDETHACGKEFEYRFTGKDSRLFLHHFMTLLSSFDSDLSDSQGNPEYPEFHYIAFICLCLRDCVSLFSRVEKLTEEQVSSLDTLCRKYFRANVLFFKVNPTIWTIGHIVPAHAKDMIRKYDHGLGLNSMEGREAKHIFISKYSNNTLPKLRWQQIFMHEYISLIWLRERGFNIAKPTNSSGQRYIPKWIDEPGYCYCGMAKAPSVASCFYCSHPLRARIEVSVEEGRLP